MRARTPFLHGPTRLRPVLLGSALALLLAGCGGGGGDPDDGATLRATLDFTRAGGSVGLTGRSIRLRVFDADGAQVGGRIVDGAGNAVQNVSVDLEDGGERRVVAELYSAEGAGGSLVGTSETLVTASPRADLRLSVGETPVGVRVTPGTAALRVGGGRPFYAAGVGASGALTFTAPGSFTYEARGGVATVSSAGIVTGTAAGTGTLLATHAPSGATGSAALTVQTTATTRGKWTVLVFLNAANDLASFSPLNVNQMESVAGNPDVRFVVQWKYSADLPYPTLFNGTRRYLVKSDTSSAIRSEVVQDLGTNVDMGSPATLKSFVEWGKSNYPAERYAVVVWNHGNGWRRSKAAGRGVSYDDALGTSIDTWELNDALPTEKLDILSWDSSLMQQLEVAYEVRDRARYVVGSEESPPGEGLPYDRIFAVFRDNPDRPTADLTKAFVDGMLAVPAYATRKITQSAVDTSRLDALAQAVDALGVQLGRGTTNGAIPGIRASSQSYSQDGARIYRDLYDVCLRIEAATDDAAIDSAAALVRTRISQAVIHEGHNSNSAGSHGLSIDFSDADHFASSATDYRRMRFGQNTRWDEFLVNAP